MSQSTDLEAAAARARNYTHKINNGSDYSYEERIFIIAVDRYKRKYKRPFPTCTEILAILKSLGYRCKEYRS